jgi:hypothetical protein
MDANHQEAIVRTRNEVSHNGGHVGIHPHVDAYWEELDVIKKKDI